MGFSVQSHTLGHMKLKVKVEYTVLAYTYTYMPWQI